MPTLTAYANDVNYQSVFVEQLRGVLDPHDLVIAISGSGNSPNVIEAVRFARAAGCRTVSLTGRDGGELGRGSDLDVNVREEHMGRIEDVHMSICHMVAFYFMDTECST